MSIPKHNEPLDAADCDLIAYLAASAGVSKAEALERLGDFLLAHNPELRRLASALDVPSPKHDGPGVAATARQVAATCTAA